MYANAIDKQACMQNQAISSLGCEPTRQPEVIAAIERLERIAQRLSQSSHVLADRLTPVLRPAGPESNQNNQLRPIGTPMADRIESLCDQMDSSMEWLNSVIGRLEI